jgi:hypothetical protein
MDGRDGDLGLSIPLILLSFHSSSPIYSYPLLLSSLISLIFLSFQRQGETKTEQNLITDLMLFFLSVSHTLHLSRCLRVSSLSPPFSSS